MFVNCEECGKRYTIDENKITGENARFKCKACGNIINVVKPPPQAEPEPMLDDFAPSLSTTEINTKQEESGQNAEYTGPERRSVKRKPQTLPAKKGGLTLGAKLLIMFLSFIVILGSALIYTYLKYVPDLITEQINLRTYSVSSYFSNTVLQPLLLRNYLQINKNTEVVSKLPGVAYATVLNKKGVVVSGLFSNLQRFSPDFIAMVKKEGFPKNLSLQNRIPDGAKKSEKDLTAGGQKIYDVGISIGNTGGEAHVGLFTVDVEKAAHPTIMPLLIILVVMAILGGLGIIFLTRTISGPIKLLTEAAERISLGEIDIAINVKGSGEIGDLAASLERMRFSIKTAIERLRQK